MSVILLLLELAVLGVIAFAFLVTELQPQNKKHDAWLAIGVPLSLVLGALLLVISAGQKIYGWLI